MSRSERATAVAFAYLAPAFGGLFLSTYTPQELTQIRAIADGLAIGVLVLSAPNGAFVYANRVFTDILGMPANPEIQAGAFARSYRLHTRDGALYPEDQLLFVRVLREKADVTVDDVVVHRLDGKKVFLGALARPLFDEAPSPTWSSASPTSRSKSRRAHAPSSPQLRSGGVDEVVVAKVFALALLVWAGVLDRHERRLGLGVSLWVELDGLGLPVVDPFAAVDRRELEGHVLLRHEPDADPDVRWDPVPAAVG